MKWIALIVPGDIEMMPYVRYFTDIFDKRSVKYDIFCWDRNNRGISDFVDKNVFVYSRVSYESKVKIQKLVDYYYFLKYLKRDVLYDKYDFIVIHTIALAIFFYPFIEEKYYNKFIFDIRDYSPLVPYFKRRIKRIIESSYLTTISSEGFKKWLPASDKYVISHNISSSLLNLTYEGRNNSASSNLNILIIGKLRNYHSNVKLLANCGNKPFVSMIFVGEGPSTSKLKKYVINKSFLNVIFSGRYRKEDEGDFVVKSDIIYNVLSVNLLENYLITNRFYLSLVYRKPMIVNQESFQSQYVQQYDLGIIISKNEDIYSKILEYFGNLDYSKFDLGCCKLLFQIQKEVLYFEDKVTNFCKM